MQTTIAILLCLILLERVVDSVPTVKTPPEVRGRQFVMHAYHQDGASIEEIFKTYNKGTKPPEFEAGVSDALRELERRENTRRVDSVALIGEYARNLEKRDVARREHGEMCDPRDRRFS